MKQVYLLLFFLMLNWGCKRNSTDVFAITFSVKSTNAYINQPVDFTVTTVSGTTYTWDYGDGSNENTSTSATHTYTKSGIYTVTVKAATSTYSKKIRIFPGTCSFQFKNSFLRSFTAPTVDIYDNSAKELIPAKLTLSDLATGSTTDTIFVNLPALSYKPNITLGLNFKNANNKTVGFSSTSFVTAAGHSIYEITGSLSGTYYYSSSTGTFISGTNTLTYTDTVN